jgi:hypothetical protein
VNATATNESPPTRLDKRREATRQAASAKRLTLSDIVTQLLARTSVERSSVELVRNAKGVTQIAVTVRTGDTENIVTALDAEKAAVDIYDRLRARYSLPDGFVGAEGHDKPRPSGGEA